MLKGGFRACGRGIKGETRNRPKAPGSVNDPGAFVSPSFFPARRRTIPLKSAQTQISQYRSAAFWVGHLVRRRQNGPAYSFCSEEDLKMRQFDFAPYRRSTVGFDRLFDLLENSARLQQADNYPPFNIERLSDDRSEEHTSELQYLMRSSYAVFCLKKKKTQTKRCNKTHNKVQKTNPDVTRLLIYYLKKKKRHKRNMT